MVPAVLALDEDCISCINPTTNELLHPTFKYFFADIESIWVRARPEHADIRYFLDSPFLTVHRFLERTNKPRFRFMSSYLQIITNELILRGRDTSATIDVVFEPGVLQFDVISVFPEILM